MEQDRRYLSDPFSDSKHVAESTNTSDETAVQHPLSPMFGFGFLKSWAKKRTDTKAAKANSDEEEKKFAATKDYMKFRGRDVRGDIDLDDGKGNGVDRSLTLDDIVPKSKLGEDRPEKRMGHTWEVLCAVKKPFSKLSDKIAKHKE